MSTLTSSPSSKDFFLINTFNSYKQLWHHPVHSTLQNTYIIINQNDSYKNYYSIIPSAESLHSLVKNINCDMMFDCDLCERKQRKPTSNLPNSRYTTPRVLHSSCNCCTPPPLTSSWSSVRSSYFLEQFSFFFVGEGYFCTFSPRVWVWVSVCGDIFHLLTKVSCKISRVKWNSTKRRRNEKKSTKQQQQQQRISYWISH